MKKTVFLLLFFLVFGFSPAQQQNEANDNEKEKKKETVETIPVSDILTRADELHTQLLKLLEKISSLPSLDPLTKAIPTLEDSLNTLFSETTDDELSRLSVRALQNVRQDWVFFNDKFNEWENELRIRSQALDDYKTIVVEKSEIRTKTGNSLKDQEIPREI